MVALVPAKKNCITYLTKTVDYLHAVKIHEILPKKYIFSKKN